MPLLTAIRVLDFGRFPAPTLGPHTQEILAAPGYDAKAVAALRAQGVV